MPGFGFRDRMGKWLNLSTVDDRSEVSTATLQYVIDVDDGLWCRACRSTDCEHTTEIEHVLGIAGLGSGNDSDVAQYISLPPIDHVTQYHTIRETIAACWFENEARLRYHEPEDGSVKRVVFGPGDPLTPTETTTLPDAKSAKECLVDALTEYCDYRQDGDLDGLSEERPELMRIIGSSGQEIDAYCREL